jgi:hypothetical protein
MKKLILIMCAILMTSIMSAQNYRIRGAEDHVKYYYFDYSMDAVNVLALGDSPNGKRGLDFDVEIGLRVGDFIPYVYYGEYIETDYKNFGFGGDYIHDIRFRPLSIAGGVNFGGIYRYGKNNKDQLYFGTTIRVKPIYELNEYVSIYLKTQFQQRNDLSSTGVFEVYTGGILKLF